MSTKKEINEYLAAEFGADEEEPAASASDSSPFELRDLGTLPSGTRVLQFEDSATEYVVLDGKSLNFFRKEHLTLDDLAMQELGASVIGREDPVDLHTSRIGDASVPSASQRREVFNELASGISSAPTMLEALYLRSTGHYLALVGDETTGKRFVIGSHTAAIECPHRSLPAWRQLSIQVGRLAASGGTI